MMTIQQFFDKAIKVGMDKDPRGKDGIKKYLARIKKNYERLSTSEKEYFDKEKLNNPYTDSRIHHVADKNKMIKKIMVGIDTDEGEILLADCLNIKGRHIDLVMGHHPIGQNLPDLPEVMDVQTDIFMQYGVPVHIAEKIMSERISEVSRNVHKTNYNRPVDMAHILDISLLNLHTPADNYLKYFLKNKLNAAKIETVGDIMDYLLTIPEYKIAKKHNAGPMIIAGAPSNRAGKIMIDMTGGTNPSAKIYEYLSRAGVSTIVGMHYQEVALENIKNNHLNVIMAGHMASDSLGMNLLLDEVLGNEKIEIIPCSGFIRIDRRPDEFTRNGRASLKAGRGKATKK